MDKPRRLLPWLFVLALLWGQAAAYAHTLSHLAQHDNPTTSSHVCELCMAQANLEGAATSTPPALHLLVGAYDWFIASVEHAPSYRPITPRARAPPVSVNA